MSDFCCYTLSERRSEPSVSRHKGESTMFSQSQEYALRAVVWLSQQAPEGPVGHLEIAQGTDVPASYLSKVLQALVRGSILNSKRGVGGGFQLARSPDELTVLEVVNAVDPIRRIDACPLGLKTHRDHLCPMHHRLDHALALVEEALSASTIREVMSAPGRPIPLVESPQRRPKSER